MTNGLCAYLFGAIAVLAALPAPLAARTNAEQDRMVIHRLNQTDFEVMEQIGLGPRGFWCGAASQLERREGRPGGTPIYLKRGRGPAVSAEGRSVIFTTDPAGLPDLGETVTVDVSRPGLMLKAFQARGFCRDAFSRSTK